MSTQLVRSSDSGKAIAFGMQWQVIVAANGRAEAQKIAKAAKATHYVLTSRQVGFCDLPTDAQSQSAVSAALVAATVSRSGVFGIKLGGNKYWFAAIHGGQIKHDAVLEFPSETDAANKLDELVNELTQLPDFNGQAQVYANISGTLNITIEYSIQSLFEVQIDGSQSLRPLSKFSGSQQGNWKGKVLFLGLAVVALGFKFGGDYYAEYKAKQYAIEHPIIAEPEITPEQAWKPVWDKFLTETPKPTNVSLQALRENLASLPVAWAGWSLTGASCTAPEALNGRSRPWSCTSIYDRSDVGITSLVMQGKVKERMPNAVATFPSSASMEVHWSIPNEEEPLLIVPGSFIDANADPVRIISQLQTYFPAMTKRPELKMVPFSLAAPKNSEGKPYPKPTSIPDLFKGEIAIAGPLRTLDVLLLSPTNMQWLSVGLKAGLNTAPDQKGIRASTFTVEAVGRIWGINPTAAATALPTASAPTNPQ